MTDAPFASSLAFDVCPLGTARSLSLDLLRDGFLAFPVEARLQVGRDVKRALRERLAGPTPVATTSPHPHVPRLRDPAAPGRALARWLQRRIQRLALGPV